MSKIIKTAVIGLGNVNQQLLGIFVDKTARLERQYGLAFQVVAGADSSGIAVWPEGIDPVTLRQHKAAGGRVSGLDGFVAGKAAESVLESLDCDLVMEASPVDLQTGGTGLAVTRVALGCGIPVVLANKGPLVLAFHELHELARAHGAGLAFSATVAGALPVVNIGRRDFVAAEISSLRAIFNSTSNFILGEMENGRSYADALREAQERGIAETDPSLDVEGWDTANKLVICANSFLGVRLTLDQVAVTGITGLKTADLQQERANGNVIKLIATAQLAAGGYQFSVQPEVLPRDSFLGGCDGWEMGIELFSDLYGKQFYKIWEREPLPTAAAMLRDAVNIFAK